MLIDLSGSNSLVLLTEQRPRYSSPSTLGGGEGLKPEASKKKEKPFSDRSPWPCLLTGVGVGAGPWNIPANALTTFNCSKDSRDQASLHYFPGKTTQPSNTAFQWLFRTSVCFSIFIFIVFVPATVL